MRPCATLDSKMPAILLGMSYFPEPQSIVPIGRMADLIGVRADWLKDQAQAGRIPHLKAGRMLLFNPEAVIAALAEQAARGGEGASNG